MSKAMLVDTTRCIACRGCQIACKQANSMPATRTQYSTAWTNPPRLSASTLTFVDFRLHPGADGTVDWSFVKRQCMHCEDPACVSACLVSALRKTREGPVIYDSSRCIGCRYCMNACPFDVLTFEWDRAAPLIQKCSFCAERQAAGLSPACAKTCPTGALQFGERDALLREANSRIYTQPAKYVPHIYGEKEVGGTSWLYISDLSPEQLGLPTGLGTKALPDLTKTFLFAVPLVLIIWPAALVGLHSLVKLRERGSRLDARPDPGDEHSGQEGGC